MYWKFNTQFKFITILFIAQVEEQFKIKIKEDYFSISIKDILKYL